MKNIVSLLIIIVIIFAGCSKGKEDGKLKVKVVYTNSNLIKKSMHIKSSEAKRVVLLNQEYYTQFGDYITGITPTKFIGKFLGMNFYSDKEVNLGGYGLTLINNNLPPDDSLRYADFTNGSSVTIIPTLGSSDKTNLFFTGGEIKFIYFKYDLDYFYQEVELPVQYDNVNLDQFNHRYGNNDYFCDSIKSGHILKVDSYPFIDNILVLAQSQGVLTTFIFGNTDTTKIVNGWSETIDSKLAPIPGICCNYVWSKNFDTLTAIMPAHDENRTITCTLSFDVSDLIQVYAGRDNIPYTSDDVIIYAPNFWDRIQVSTTEN